MNKFSNNAELQTAALELVCVMGTKDPAKKSSLLSRGVVSRAIQNCVDEAPEPLLAMSLTAVDFMADTEECRHLLLTPQVLQVLLDGIEAFHSNVDIVLHGVSILTTLAVMEPESHDLLMEVESYATVITILSEYEDSKTIRTTCLSFLESIFADKNHCLTICEREGLPHLVRDLENKHHDKLISYLNILSVVFKHGLTVKMIFQCGVLDKLYLVLRKNAEEPAVVSAGLRLLASVMTTTEIIPGIVAKDYLPAIIWCADNYKENTEVNLEVMTVLQHGVRHGGADEGGHDVPRPGLPDVHAPGREQGD